MDISIGNEILALFLCLVYTFFIKGVGAVWHPQSELLHDVALAVGELAGVIAITIMGKAPLTGVVVVLVLLLGYEHYFSAWRQAHSITERRKTVA